MQAHFQDPKLRWIKQSEIRDLPETAKNQQRQQQFPSRANCKPVTNRRERVEVPADKQKTPDSKTRGCYY